LLRWALTRLEQTLKSDHPQVAVVLVTLASLLRQQKRYEEAEILCQRALTRQQEFWGPEHPQLVSTLREYAQILRRTGRRDEAAVLSARAKVIRVAPVEP
jgi:tetratricopeptide (TPR) repeat protein